MLLVAGSCLIQKPLDECYELAVKLKKAGADIFRGKCWGGGTNPPTRPAYWGLGYEGVKFMQDVQRTLMPVAVEVQVREHLDMCVSLGIKNVWLAARSMQQYPLLVDIGKECRDNGITLMIKRHQGATLADLKGAIDYVLTSYCEKNLWVIERGVCTFDRTDETRWRPDLLVVPQLKDCYPDLNVMVDCSHSVGNSKYVMPIAKAAKGVGADGIMVEVFDPPKDSISDRQQTIDLKTFRKLVKEVK